MNKLRTHSKKVLIGIVGGLIVLVGLILVPYPGPGWLIVFAGLAILATEFQSAQKVLHFVRGKYDTWVAWIKRQSVFVQLVVLLFTGLVVAVTIWLLNGFGILVGLFNLPYDFLVSPLFR